MAAIDDRADLSTVVAVGLAVLLAAAEVTAVTAFVTPAVEPCTPYCRVDSFDENSPRYNSFCTSRNKLLIYTAVKPLRDE